MRPVLLAVAVLLCLPVTAGAVARGRPVAPDEAPWLVALRSNGTTCGGALVAPDKVVTAAHCVQGARPGKPRLELGAGVVDAQTRPLRWTRATFPRTYELLPSPEAPDDPRRAATVHDLAVLHLATPVDGVAPLTIAGAPPAPGEPLVTYGRGRIGPGSASVGPDDRDPGRGPARPRAADGVVLDGAACRSAYTTLFRAASHLCPEDPEPAHAQACAGDSGGPLVVRRDGRAELVALVTWGGETRNRDCGEGLPDVSERVLPHLAAITAPPATAAPYAERRTRVRRADGVLRCVSGPWHPAGVRLRVSWFTPGGPVRERRPSGAVRLSRGPDRALPGVHTSRIRARRTPLGCTVRAETEGGWTEERAYNAR